MTLEKNPLRYLASPGIERIDFDAAIDAMLARRFVAFDSSAAASARSSSRFCTSCCCLKSVLNVERTGTLGGGADPPHASTTECSRNCAAEPR